MATVVFEGDCLTVFKQSPTARALPSTSRAGSACSALPVFRLSCAQGRLFLQDVCIYLIVMKKGKPHLLEAGPADQQSDFCPLLGACFPFSFSPALLDPPCSPRAASSRLRTLSISYATLTEFSSPAPAADIYFLRFSGYKPEMEVSAGLAPSEAG